MFRRCYTSGRNILLSISHLPLTPSTSPMTRSLQAMTSLKKKINPGFSGYLLLIIPGATFCLGCWQVQRRQWKMRLVEELHGQIGQPPVELPDTLEEVAALEYRRVAVRGTFQHDKEMLYGPRPQLHSGKFMENGSLVSTGSSGFLVVTPFTLTDSGATILVNRGWVTKHARRPSQRVSGQVLGEQEMTCVVRLQEKRPPFMPKTKGTSDHYLYRDVESMSRAAGCAPVFVDACDGVPGGPNGGQTMVTLRNEHLSYLLTWYGLTAVTSFLWYRRFVNIRAWL